MGIFRGLKSRNDRIVTDYSKLGKLVEGFHAVELTSVVTIGTFDGIHVGHSRYLERAENMGDLLIVGIDSDRAVKVYKGPQRPIVPEDERLEMLLHTGYPDFVTIIDDVDNAGNWQFGLIEAVRPKIFVAVQDSYPQDQLEGIGQFCGEIKVLDRQAETSSSEKLRQAMIAQSQPIADQLRSLAERVEKGELDA